MDDISRRTVLGGVAGAAALVTLGVQADAAAAAPVAAPLRAHYATSVGKTFTAVQGRRSYQVTLRAIRDAVPARSKDRPYSFTLIFAPARGVRVPEGIYQLRRNGVVTHSLLLSTVGTAGQLQAAINGASR